MTQYDAKEAAQERSILRLQTLLGRLEVAKCWSDETTCGIRATKWLHLSPADLDMAKDFIREHIAAVQS